MRKFKSAVKQFIADFLQIIFICGSILVLSWLFVAQLLEVNGLSMYPTLNDKEQILAEKLSVEFKELKRGEIVVLKSPENSNILIVKRVVGLPGEKFEITDNEIYINDQVLNEAYLTNDVVTQTKELNTAVFIPEGSFIVLGDNREQSIDSRDFGLVDERLIVGRAVFVYYPIQNFRLLNVQ